MQEIRCPKCGEVFQVDDSGYDQIAQQVRDREFEKELDRRKKDLDAKREQELEIIRLQEEKEHKLEQNLVRANVCPLPATRNYPR